MLRFVLPAALWVAFVLPAHAEIRPEVRELYDALGMSEVIGIMRREGIEYGGTIEDDLFPGRGGPAWAGLVDRIYDQDDMEAAVLDRFGDELAQVDVDPLVAFFESDRGRRIVEFEVSAREALMDEDVEAAARESMIALRSDNRGRFDLIDEFVAANDLVESNVMGAMNSNYAFYTGLMAGNAFPRELTESDILADVWAQEAEIRADTEDWVYSYLGLAYQPLSDADLEAYIALSRTEEGRAMNRALFAAFDVMYNEISHNLGLGAAGFMAGQDI